MLPFRQSAQEAHSDEGTLERLLEDARSYSAEFPLFLANHQPMMLVALDRLGASPERLEEWFAIYRDVSGLVPQPPSVAKIGCADWASHLGDRSRERDYREFFTGEVRRLGIGPAVAAYLPTLIARHRRQRTPLLHAAQLRRHAEQSGGGRSGARLLVRGLS